MIIPEPANTLIDRTIGHEGGYVNDPDDPGGETNWGIAKRYHPTVDIRNLTRDGAKAIYFEKYFVEPRIDQLPAWLQPVMFDMAVNPGPGSAITILQRALGVTTDGNLGPYTLHAVTGTQRPKLLHAIAVERLTYYMQRIAKNPVKKKYARGWARRSLAYLG